MIEEMHQVQIEPVLNDYILPTPFLTRNDMTLSIAARSKVACDLYQEIENESGGRGAVDKKAFASKFDEVATTENEEGEWERSQAAFDYYSLIARAPQSVNSEKNSNEKAFAREMSLAHARFLVDNGPLENQKTYKDVISDAATESRRLRREQMINGLKSKTIWKHRG